MKTGKHFTKNTCAYKKQKAEHVRSESINETTLRRRPLLQRIARLWATISPQCGQCRIAVGNRSHSESAEVVWERIIPRLTRRRIAVGNRSHGESAVFLWERIIPRFFGRYAADANRGRGSHHTQPAPFGVMALLGAALLAVATPIAVLAQTLPSQSAIASAHPLATQAGHEILAAGGNAFDAAVAVASALAVVEPAGSGLGGGGFFLLHRAKDGFQTMVDARETAPGAATATMYLDDEGKPIPRASIDGPLAAGIPGTPAALDHLAKKYGKLPLASSLAPATRLAEQGFATDDRFAMLAKWRLDALRASPAAAAIFLNNNDVPEPGHMLRQADLAQTLRALAGGAVHFYTGEIARRLVEGSRVAGGIWTLDDLAGYKIVEREPIRGKFGDINIVSVPPPSAGGIALVTMLNILDGYPWDELSETQRHHVLIEAMRRAYRDRTQYFGDPDFVKIPVERLTHPFYSDGLRNSIRMDRATPSAVLPGAPAVAQGQDTTHFSILDQEGNMVAATLSVNLPYGSGFVPPGTGVLLNNEMDDFSIKPGTPNAYGLVGHPANEIAPNKRPLSSMSPTLLMGPDRVGILGTPGGSRIITMVLLGALSFADGHNASDWVSRPRFHHQFLPDEVQFEADALSPELQGALQALGHQLKPSSRQYGNMQAVAWDLRSGAVTAASDPRGGGGAITKTHATK